MTTMAHTWKPSPAQIELLKTVFTERVPADEPNREQFYRNLTQNISNRATFEDALAKLKARPRADRPVYVAPVAPVRTYRTDIATEPGLYRNPEDGTLYKLGAKSGTFATPPLAVYSNKAVYRRLTPEGQMVKKGKWTRLDAYQTRKMLAKSTHVSGPRVLAEWLMTDEDKQEWAVGFCLFCSKPLIDAVSVFNSIGPKCANDRGIVRDIPPLHLAQEIEKVVLAK